MHDHHRERVKNKMLEHGVESAYDYEILECLLFYCIPRKDTKTIAHQLLEEFGCLKNILEAGPGRLSEIKGVGQGTELFFQLLCELKRRTMLDEMGERPTLDTLAKAVDYFRALLYGKRDETFYLLCLDNRARLIKAVKISEGTLDQTAIYPRKVLEIALRYRAVNLLLGHNHPQSDAKPSNEDISSTGELMRAMKTAGICVMDHIIISGEKYISLADCGVQARSADPAYAGSDIGMRYLAEKPRIR